MRYRNPILPGFHPDPSVCRVGEDYYLVNSSFEYFPGVPLFHSRDLVHWRQLGHVLTRPGQLPLAGTPESDGIYAPTLRHHRGRFYLATTNKIPGRGFRNFFVTADSPAGPWSDPIWVEQGGIDPSLCFDPDGSVYWTANGTGWADVRGIYQSEIDPATGKLRSDVRLIWRGSGGSYPEAPHLFKRGAYYYLSVAEGGTEECHMVTIARARHPFGPFEPCPHNPVLTHRSLMSTIAATGHADFFPDHHGRWWVVFLGIRYSEYRFHPLGRETFLAPVEWTPLGWPIVHDARPITEVMDVARDFVPHPWPEPAPRDDFDAPEPAACWVGRRNPVPHACSLARRPGWLTLACLPDSLDGDGSPAALFRRLQHFEVTAATRLDFTPGTEVEEAGLTALLDSRHHAELVVTRRRDRRVALVRRRIGSLREEGPPLELADGPVELALAIDRRELRFAVTSGGVTREAGRHELRYLSSEVAGGYTGTMLGLFASARGTVSPHAAAFDWFDYRPTSVA